MQFTQDHFSSISATQDLLVKTKPKPWPDQQKDNNKYKDKYIREHLERAIFGTFDLWDIWSEWWGNMTWPKKNNDKEKDN